MDSKKVIVLTGGTSGIGKSALEEFARKKHEVLLVFRSQEKAEKLKFDLENSFPGFSLSLMPACDFSDLKSVQKCGEYIAQTYPKIDLLLNNAGLVCMQKSFTNEGVEKTFSTNHLAHFVLTLQLLPSLKNSKQARIIHTSSEAHYIPKDNFLDDLNFENKRYFVMQAYGNSKLANVLFAKKLARELKDFGIASHSFHPGRVQTGIWPKNTWYEKTFTAFVSLFLISAEQGARPLISLAFDEKYQCQESVFLMEMKQKKPHKFAQSDQNQDRLWDLSLKLCQDFLPL